jgi:hypothetical protein
MHSKIIKVRYPNLRGNSIKSAAHTNQERLLKTLNHLMIKESTNGSSKEKTMMEGSGIEGSRASTKNNSLTAKELALAPRASERRSKKPKTFAL